MPMLSYVCGNVASRIIFLETSQVILMHSQVWVLLLTVYCKDGIQEPRIVNVLKNEESTGKEAKSSPSWILTYTT